MRDIALRVYLQLKRFTENDKGANALEYALVMILVAFAIVAGATTLGTGLNGLFANIGAKVNAVVVPAL